MKHTCFVATALLLTAAMHMSSMQGRCNCPEGKVTHQPRFSPRWRTDIRASRRRHSDRPTYQCKAIAAVEDCGKQPNVTAHTAGISQADVAIHYSKNRLSATHLEAVARQFYEEVWSKGKIRLLDKLMSEIHEQHDMVWQPRRTGTGTDGRKRMKRGILAYRTAYPDLQFRILLCCAAPTSSHGSHSSHHNDMISLATSVPSNCSKEDLQYLDRVQAPDQLQSAGSVLVHWQASGTNLGPIRDAPPSGKRVEFSGISRLDFDLQGRITRSQVFRQATEDEANYFMSAGITPWAQAAQSPAT